MLKVIKMHIKSIVLDGFKSYGNRVEVTGFDPEFNAITGLNGTGKSNILDSICFVLGITNLSNVSMNFSGFSVIVLFGYHSPANCCVVCKRLRSALGVSRS